MLGGHARIPREWIYTIVKTGVRPSRFATGYPQQLVDDLRDSNRCNSALTLIHTGDIGPLHTIHVEIMSGLKFPARCILSTRLFVERLFHYYYQELIIFLKLKIIRSNVCSSGKCRNTDMIFFDLSHYSWKFRIFSRSVHIAIYHASVNKNADVYIPVVHPRIFFRARRKCRATPRIPRSICSLVLNRLVK